MASTIGPIRQFIGADRRHRERAADLFRLADPGRMALRRRHGFDETMGRNAPARLKADRRAEGARRRSAQGAEVSARLQCDHAVNELFRGAITAGSRNGLCHGRCMCHAHHAFRSKPTTSSDGAQVRGRVDFTTAMIAPHTCTTGRMKIRSAHDRTGMRSLERLSLSEGRQITEIRSCRLAIYSRAISSAAVDAIRRIAREAFADRRREGS